MGLVRASAASIALSLTLTACGEVTPPSRDVEGRVVITPGQVRLAAAGETGRLRAGFYDIFGALVPRVAVRWTAIDPDVFTIDQTGLVTATRAPAVGRAVASAGSRADTAYVVVADPNASPCLGSTAPVSLAVGQAVTVSMSDGACITSAGGGDEYLVMPWQGSTVGSSTVALEVTGSGLSALGPSPSISAAVSRASTPLRSRSSEFERRLRETSRVELMPMAR
jgi:hypothetical protein